MFFLYFIKDAESKEEREHFFSFCWKHWGRYRTGKKEMVRTREKALREDVKKAG